MVGWITPHHLNIEFSEPLSIDDKIQIVAAQVRGWQLEIANNCINLGLACMRHSGFAVLMMVLWYFEQIAKYKDGYTRDLTGRDLGTRRYFTCGLKDVFSDLFAGWPPQDIEDAATILYLSGRCGLYHAGMTRARLSISAGFPLLEYDRKGQEVHVNPHLLVPRLQEHFEEYVMLLADPSDPHGLRANFQARYDALAACDPLQSG